MTAQVIDFMAHLHARRSAGAILAPVQASEPEPVQASEPEHLTETLGLYEDTVFKGSKYHANLQTRDIPALIRADIKAAKISRKIHKDVKVSVRFESYSGGCAIRVNVTHVPSGFAIANPAFAPAWEAHEKAQKSFFDFTKVPRYTSEAQALLDTVSNIVTSYQRRRENLNSDYSNVNFDGGDVRFDLA